MRVMTQLSGVSSPFSLLGSSFMIPPVLAYVPEVGLFVLALAESNYPVILPVVTSRLTLHAESGISDSMG